MTRLDGGALDANRCARGVVIEKNKITWNGDVAVSMCGDTEHVDGTKMGLDGTTGI